MPMVETSRAGGNVAARERASVEVHELRVEARSFESEAAASAAGRGKRLLLLLLAASELALLGAVQVAWLITLGYLAHRFVLRPLLGY